MNTRQFTTLISTLLLVPACAQFEMNANGKFDEAADAGSGNDTGLDTANSEDLVRVPVEFWTLQMQVSLTDGRLDPQESSFMVEYWGGQQMLCTAALFQDQDFDNTIDSAPLESTPLTDTTQDLIQGWTIQLSEDDECQNKLPGPLLLGIGPLDSQLIPAVISADLNPDTLNGIYVQGIDATSTVYTFGVIGTQSQYDGVTGPVTDAPVPDGTYTSEPLYMLPFIDD